ncbi:hypothetical protein KDW_50300 [Dictyobacter vulcani]|uniref:Uncharacterized protein n=1 Tax=Dictyobacter vulcani TaxID=2607529 RepID=A0A5J4KMC0_9CHLR|nr:hypothetical protein [Dictyobacter vulcani]GER90868.1 hypothetical protein KDW_50300 [Dictyobacter vulcani]
MDSIEFIDYIEPYIEASVDYIVQDMQQCGLYDANRHETFWNMLFEEIGHFLVRTYDSYEVEELIASSGTMCWAFGYDQDVAGWTWIRGEETLVRLEEGPVMQALRNSHMDIAAFYQKYPRQHWLEIWYGPGPVKLLRRRDEQLLLTLPAFLEARIELLQHRLNRYYTKDHQDEREVEAEDAAGMVVKIRQKRLIIAEADAPQAFRYTCQIEQPRGLIQFSSEKFPSKSLDELILMLNYDFADFEHFFARNRFEEVIGPIMNKNAVLAWNTVAQAQEDARALIIVKEDEHNA